MWLKKSFSEWVKFNDNSIDVNPLPLFRLIPFVLPERLLKIEEAKSLTSKELRGPCTVLYMSLIKRGGMLVVSPRDVNFGFWSNLWCSGRNAIIFSLKVSFREPSA